MYVKPGSSVNLQLIPVIKVDSNYTWSAANGNTMYLSNVKQGQWITDTIPIANFLAPGVTDVRQVLFQWNASGAPYDSGVIYFDNFRADNDTFANFNTGGVTWTSTCDSAKISLVKYSDVAGGASVNGNKSLSTATWRPEVIFHGKTITLRLRQAIDATISIFDLRGKTVAAMNCGKISAGLYLVSLQRLSAGPYILELRRGTNRMISSFIMQ